MKISKPIVLVLSSAMILSAISLSGCQAASKKISCKDLFTPEFSGLSGAAYINDYSSVTYDNKLKMEKLLIGDVDTAKLNSSQSEQYYDAVYKVDKFVESISFTIEDTSKSGKYENGDQIKVQAKYNQNYAKLMNLDIKDTTFVYKISGINEGTKINPFENLKVSYEGSSPNGRVKIDSSECPDFVKNHMSFYSSESSRLKNGQKITITASYSTSRANNEEVIITKEEQEYTVSGLNEYPTSLDGLALSDVNNKLEQHAKADISDDYKNGDSVYGDGYSIDITSQNVKVARKLFVNKKLVSDYSTPSNSYVFIYEVTFSGKVRYDGSKYKKGQEAKITKYYYNQVPNILVTSDKKVVFSEDDIYGSMTNYTLDEITERTRSDDSYTVTEVK